MIDNNEDTRQPFTPEQLADWGITPTDRKKEKGEKGFIKVGDTIYSIDNYERQQRPGLDTDQGDVFSSDLYDVAAAQGFEVSDFNTYNDVSGALNYLYDLDQIVAIDEEEEEEEEEKEYIPSAELTRANQIISDREKSILDGSYSKAVFGKDDAQAKTAAILAKYNANIEPTLRPSIQSMLNAETVVMNSPMKSSSGRDDQTSFPNPGWVWN